jgi:hypothetical protein
MRRGERRCVSESRSRRSIGRFGSRKRVQGSDHPSLFSVGRIDKVKQPAVDAQSAFPHAYLDRVAYDSLRQKIKLRGAFPRGSVSGDFCIAASREATRVGTACRPSSFWARDRAFGRFAAAISWAQPLPQAASPARFSTWQASMRLQPRLKGNASSIGSGALATSKRCRRMYAWSAGHSMNFHFPGGFLRGSGMAPATGSFHALHVARARGAGRSKELDHCTALRLRSEMRAGAAAGGRPIPPAAR